MDRHTQNVPSKSQTCMQCTVTVGLANNDATSFFV